MQLQDFHFNNLVNGAGIIEMMKNRMAFTKGMRKELNKEVVSVYSRLSMRSSRILKHNCICNFFHWNEGAGLCIFLSANH